MHIAGKSFIAPLTALAAAALLAACGGDSGPTRSVSSFCSTLASEKEAYLSKYDTRADTIESSSLDDFSKAFASLGSAVEAMGDAVRIFDRLDRVAPDDIQPDVAAIRDSLQKQIDNAGDAVSNPLGALAGGLVSGLSTMGSWQRVEDYIETNC
jgi:hypothetical protein